MKKFIALTLAAAITFTLAAPVFAADTVTAAQLNEVISKESLANNAADYDAFTKSTMPEPYMTDFMEGFNAETAYPMYEYDEGEDKNAEPLKKVSDKLTYNNPDRGLQYIMYTKPGKYGLVDSVHMEFSGKEDGLGYGNYGSNYGMEKLLYRTDDLARIINDEGIGLPDSVKYINGFYHDEQGKYFRMFITPKVLLEKDGREYVITSVSYRDGQLTDYEIITGEEFINLWNEDSDSAMSAIQKHAFERTPVKSAPFFTDTDNMLAKFGIVDGYSDGTFKPQNNVTRAEAAKMLALLVAHRDENFDEFRLYNQWEIFSDVPDSHWAKKYIIYGNTRGYIDGGESTGTVDISDRSTYHDVVDGKVVTAVFENHFLDTYAFHPENNVTERELATMIVRAIDSYGDEMAKAEGGYPMGYVSVAKRFGIAENASDAPATRLTAARMLNNALTAEGVTGYVVDHIQTQTRDKDAHYWDAYSYETIYQKSDFFSGASFAKRSMRLKGKITASHDTDETLNEGGRRDLARNEL